LADSDSIIANGLRGLRDETLKPELVHELRGLRADGHRPRHVDTTGSLYVARRPYSSGDCNARIQTLDTLKAIGEVLELEFRDGSNRYDGVRPQAHPHLVCTRCGKIEDVDLDGISALAAEAAASTGYEIRSHRVDFYGLCAGCRVPV
jgi:hypothetical protein